MRKGQVLAMDILITTITLGLLGYTAYLSTFWKMLGFGATALLNVVFAIIRWSKYGV